MKIILFLALCFTIGSVSAQETTFLPKQSQFIFSIAGATIFNDVPLEDIQKYDFMAEVSKEMFKDASKPIAEYGFDLNGDFLFFGGDTPKYALFGASVQIDDLDKVLTNMRMNADRINAIKTKGYYLNNGKLIAVKGNRLLFAEVDIHYRVVREYVDSVFIANEWMEERSSYYKEYYYESDEAMEVMEAVETVDEPAYATPPSAQIEVEKEIEIVKAFPNKYEYRDSISESWEQKEAMLIFSDFTSNNSLLKENNQIKSALENKDQAMFFFDASKFYKNSHEIERELRNNPIINKNNSVFQDQWYHATANFTDEGILGEMDMHGHKEIMQVVDQLGDSKLDKTLLKYISEDNIGFVVGNASYREAYEKFKSIYMPKLENSEDERLQLGSALWYSWDRLINKDALFELYSGRMFMSFDGFKQMLTTKISYEYNEETFDYVETEVESLEALPIFSFGVSTTETSIAVKYLEALCKSEKKYFTKIDDYYVLRDNEFHVPIYITVVDGLFLLSNDISVVTNNRNGVENKLKGKSKKNAKKTNMLYAEVDYAKLLQSIPMEYVGSSNYDMFQTMAGKVGDMNISFKDVKDDNLKMVVNYTFNGDYKNGGYYMLDLINTMYLKATR